MIKIEGNKFELLTKREIIYILIGDTELGNYTLLNGTTTVLKMPRYTGQEICDLSKQFGFPMPYEVDGKCLSRWKYFDKLIKCCIEENKCSDLLNYIFSKEAFAKIFKMNHLSDIKKLHEATVNKAIESINGTLYIGGNELVKIGSNYMVQSIDGEVLIPKENIKQIDREFISNITSRAIKNIKNGEYDSAITKSRTLMEEVFIYVIKMKEDVNENKGDITKLYKQVRKLYNMDIDPNADERIKKLLSGLNTIVDSIAEMRNKSSDAHGLGDERINISKHHAQLCLNAAITVSEFILSVMINQN
ncbi:abortive infection family protein [Fenollaria timonensis]|uniref:abortive infection family protein n=1 Tax=Fenollaria timonensis TaxID=1723384 RepID=UPI0026ED3F62|nr:abortive infection family protein [Fenollaria timonensis]